MDKLEITEKTFITWKNDKVDRIQIGKAPVGNADWVEVPDNWGGAHGAKREWFDENMIRVPDQELVKRGIRTDNKGDWYDKDTGERKKIDDYDVPIDTDKFTRDAPIPNEAYQMFDRAQNEWVIDTEKKERAEKEAEISAVKAQIENAERKIIRPLRAINRNRATQEDLDKFDEYDTLIEEELRPELNRLELELQSA